MTRTSFVGREAELSALTDRVRRDRLVTILGPPGAGKTRIAERFVTRWRGDAIFVCLAGARRRVDVVRALSDAIEVPLTGEDSADDLDRLGRALAARGRSLAVLDNVEQVAADVAAAVSTWLDLAPGARFLCTSRVRLGLTDESCFALGGMAREQARALFLERARLVGDPALVEPGPLDELLERLDRLPLAIELAASRAGVLSPKQLLDGLGRRFDLLQAPEAADARHATMRAAIDLSWELLSEQDRRALSRLSVLRGPFSLADAAAVLGSDEAGALGSIESLREHSMLAVVPFAGELGFALYESIREYAAERLAGEGATAEAEVSHARHFADLGRRLADELSGPSPRRAVDGLARILDQLLAAHERMREREPSLAIEAALAANALLVRRGPFETERELYADALILAERLGAPALVARVLCARGRSSVMHGMFLEARPDLERARTAARLAGDRALEAFATYLLSAAWREAGDAPAHARALADEALAIARETFRDDLVAWCIASVAAAASAMGELDLALDLHADAVARLERLGQVRAVALTLGNLALVQELLGRLDEALATNVEAIRRCEETGDEVLLGKIRWTLSRLSFDAGHAEAADAELARLEASARRTGDRELVAQVLLENARRSLVRGDRNAGHVWLARAEAPVRACGAPRLEDELGALRAMADSARLHLRADLSGAWFERPGLGRVELSRRRSLRLIFARLVEAHVANAGALSVEALVDAGWPGESPLPESGSMRVWTAIRTLRRLGLANVLVSRDGGYSLDPSVPIELG